MKHEENLVVFQTPEEEITYGKIVKTLYQLGTEDCDVLFVHSDISFGRVSKGIKRKELKEILVDAILETNVKTIVFPTFTFSYCNKEDFDIQNSKTAMGMLPEYVRTREDVVRSDDPILSVVILGESQGMEKMIGESSCGTGGIFHILHNSGKKVKFLFFGTQVTKCFTYLHYVEEIKNVSYRYAKPFLGKVIRDGKEEEKEIKLFVRYKGVCPTLPEDFAQQLIERNIMTHKELGLSSVSLVDEKESYQYISSLIDENPYVFAVMPETNELIKDYQYGNVVAM